MLFLFLLGPACRTYEIPNFDEPTLDWEVSNPDISADVPSNDMDQDGFTHNDGDCNDLDPSVHPDAVEIWYDGVDQNCDGLSDYDKDGDGFRSENYLTSLSFGGGDCDDDDALTHPSAEEIWYDGVDQNCDGGDDYDQDGDGVVPDEYAHLSSLEAGDCDDTNAIISPNSIEHWYDGVDRNCDGKDDFDKDGDGYAADIHFYDGPLPMGDCDDSNPQLHPGMTEIWYDGVDQNCDHHNDFDQDGDGYRSAEYVSSSYLGAVDCDDLDASVSPGVPEIWYDGFDQNCDGEDDYDQDGDGFILEQYSTLSDLTVGDCNDADSVTYPGAPEIWYDGVDQNCDGGDDYDQDGDGYVPQMYASVSALPSGDCDDVNEETLEDCHQCEGLPPFMTKSFAYYKKDEVNYYWGEDPTGNTYTIFIAHPMTSMGEGTFSYTYDDFGTRLSMVYEQDIDMDDVPDYTMTCTYTNGVESCIETTHLDLIVTYSNGQLTARIWEVHPYPDMDEYHQYTFDENGILTEFKHYYDETGFGGTTTTIMYAQSEFGGYVRTYYEEEYEHSGYETFMSIDYHENGNPWLYEEYAQRGNDPLYITKIFDQEGVLLWEEEKESLWWDSMHGYSFATQNYYLNGRLCGVVDMSISMNGSSESSGVDAQYWDEQGKEVYYESTDYDNNGGGYVTSRYEVREYDADGLPLHFYSGLYDDQELYTGELIDTSDETIWTHTRDSENNLVSSFSQQDAYEEYCLNGSCSISGEIQRDSKEEYILDSHNNPVSALLEVDATRTGQWVATGNTMWTNTYDLDGSPILIVKEVDQDNNGTVDRWEEESWTRNSDGEILHYELLIDAENDGNIIVASTQEFGFDLQGNATLESKIEDYDHDGVADRSYTKIWSQTYDINGLMLSQEYSHVDSIQSIDTHERNTWTYDANGQRNSHKVEDLNSGVVTYRSWETIGTQEQDKAYSLVSAGVTEIAYLYGCMEDEEVSHTFTYEP